MSLKYHEISEAYHRILNPFTEDKLMLLGDIARLRRGMRQLDLCCGKGEMLSRWAQHYGISGVGVDISPVFLEAAHKRAQELGVEDRVTFIQGDAGKYSAELEAFDVVSCIGATWIGDGVVGTIRLMLPALKPGGLLLVGEPFWSDQPPDEAYDVMGLRRDEFCDLCGLLNRFKAAEVELVEMVNANLDSWDRYEALHWMAIDDYIRANPRDPEVPALREWNAKNKEKYLKYGRRYLGWGVFVLRPTFTG
jgi:SAM-dependent methyltransferase